jgi:hypothetical protein
VFQIYGMPHSFKIFCTHINHGCFKETFEFEKYLEILDNKYLLDFFKFRTSNHKLPIECGRWQNIERNRRLCKLCQKHEIGDEFPYINIEQHKPHWKQTMIYRTLNNEQHKPHWKQTMIYRTLNIEQHKPHWKQTMIYRTLNIEQHKPHWKQTMISLFVFSVVCVAQCLVFCRSLFVFSVVCVAQCLVFCVVFLLKTNNDLQNRTLNIE